MLVVVEVVHTTVELQGLVVPGAAEQEVPEIPEVLMELLIQVVAVEAQVVILRLVQTVAAAS
jgi:hypothetical protein